MEAKTCCLGMDTAISLEWIWKLGGKWYIWRVINSHINYCPFCGKKLESEE